MDKFLAKYVSRWWKYLVLGIVALAVATILSLITPRLIQKAIDELTKGVYANLSRYSIFIVAIAVIRAFLTYLQKK